MNAGQFYKGLPENEKLAVIKLALPGIDVFLKEILVAENLGKEGEKLRQDYVQILKNWEPSQRSQEAASLNTNVEDSLKKLSREISFQLSRSNENGDLSFVKGYSEGTDQHCCPEIPAAEEEKEDSSRLPMRKGTDSTEESGIYLCSSSLSCSDAATHTDALNPSLDLPMLDSVDVWSRETIISESGSADYEVQDWESDANGNEEGYCTGDNVFVDFSVQKLNLQPNESGELHCGVMYIREQPGWHKRWFTITDHCLKCYRHRCESKMLFEFPLKGTRIIPTDRKKSRMFPITLSVPRIHESITFATTEEQLRQEWIYALNFVISRLLEDDNIPDRTDGQYVMPLDSYFWGERSNDKSIHTSLPKVNRNRLSVDSLPEEQDTERRRKLSGCLEVPKRLDPGKQWTDGNENIDTADCALTQWSIGVGGEDEMPVMDTSVSLEIDEDESFRELQELLPDIIQGRKISSTVGKRINKMCKAQSCNNVEQLTSEDGETVLSQGSTLSTSSSEGRSCSISDLQNAASAGSKVKRHSSLANALSNKAMRVKSRIAGSLFKKARKDNLKTRNDSELASFQSTTFSGYLMRKKGPLWKNRWCVVKEHSLFCYKDFGVGTAELEVPLHGAVMSVLNENEAEKQAYMFALNSEKEELLFAAENDAELEEWIMVLEEEIKVNEELSSATTDTPANFVFPASPSEVRTEPSPLGKKTKGSNKKAKASSPTGTKKTSILGSIGHKLTKSKPKPVQATLTVPFVDERGVSGSVEDGFVFVEHATNAEPSTGASPSFVERSVDSLQSVTPRSLSKEGFLNQRVDEDTWLKCWVKLQNHALHIHDDKDSEDSVVVKIKLSNCVVRDWDNEQRPHVMEIRRVLGRPLYLQAQSESDCAHWKSVICGSIITTPTAVRRPVLNQSSTPIIPLLNTNGDSLDRDDVFPKPDESQISPSRDPARPYTPLNPSPRPSTAGDVSNSESDEGESSSQAVIPRSEEALTLRSFSGDEQEEERKTTSKLHRSISNAIPVFPHFPGIRKRRSRTVPGTNVSPDLLVDVRHSSCLFLRNSSGLWTKRWCVLQRDNLHLFRRPDEVVPAVSLPLKSCEVRRANRKVKKFTFEVSTPSEKEDYCFAADNEKEMVTWMRFLRAVAEETAEQGSTKEANHITNGEETHDVRQSDEPITAGTPQLVEQSPKDTNESVDTGVGVSAASSRDTRTSGESPTLGERSKNVAVSVVTKPTSLDGVLQLLQEQQLMQQLGRQKYIRTKKTQEAWKRSVAAVLKDRSARPETSTRKRDANQDKVANDTKQRTRSATQPSTIELNAGEHPLDIIEQFEKLAEEKKLKSLKNDTLLKKRRNSLTLEKDVLQRKMTKGHEKKATVKKLLGKDESTSKEEKEHAEQRLQKVNQELAAIERDLVDNKRQQAQALDNLNAMKTRSVRRLSLMSDNKTRSDQRRVAFKNSASESTSSQGSTEEKSGKESPKAQSPVVCGTACKQSAALSLAMLEQELRKISPHRGRRATVTGEPKHGRVSFSSEGSQDDSLLKDSPTSDVKRVSLSSEGSVNDQMALPNCRFNADSAELRRKKFSASGAQCAFNDLSVEIPTDEDSKTEEQYTAVIRRLSVNSEKGTSLDSKTGGHRASLMNALSQIKDFEDFAAVSRTGNVSR